VKNAGTAGGSALAVPVKLNRQSLKPCLTVNFMRFFKEKSLKKRMNITVSYFSSFQIF